MKYYWLVWFAGLSCLFMYFLGGKDQVDDLKFACKTSYQFVADGETFVCIPRSEYFKDEK